ncbi:MAG: hypothetical protein MI924_25895, partial [Chloroflexales bacterium]|nr:hypothetical protein [Chloroflexales bacterium]
FPETPYSLHPYQYGYSNPALWTDPTGNDPLQAHAINALIERATTVYSKDAWGCFLMHDDGIAAADDVGDLWIDDICEFGPRDRVFGQKARMTVALRVTKIIARLRSPFDAQGGTSLKSDKSSQMGPIDFLEAKFIDWTYTNRMITITDFLGGLDEWSVTRARSAAGKDVTRFEISNETTRFSGTRIGFTRDGTEELSLELYRINPARYNRDGSAKVDILRIDDTQYSLVSILAEKRDREPDKKGGRIVGQWERGGGTMTQRFIWEEPDDPCYNPRQIYG